MNDDGVSQELKLVSVSLKHDDRILIFIVKGLIQRRHQRAELRTASKTRSFTANAEKTFSSSVSLEQRLQTSLKLSLIVGEVH